MELMTAVMALLFLGLAIVGCSVVDLVAPAATVEELKVEEDILIRVDPDPERGFQIPYYLYIPQTNFLPHLERIAVCKYRIFLVRLVIQVERDIRWPGKGGLGGWTIWN